MSKMYSRLRRRGSESTNERDLKRKLFRKTRMRRWVSQDKDLAKNDRLKVRERLHCKCGSQLSVARGWFKLTR